MAASYDITLSVGLIEKLAGLRKKQEPLTQRPKQAAPLGLIGSPLKPMISPQAQSLLAREVQLTQALAATKEVGGLLLKRETEDLRAISSKTEELLSKYRVEPKPLPCSSERDACTACFSKNTQDASVCMGLSQAYQACSQKAFIAAAS